MTGGIPDELPVTLFVDLPQIERPAMLIAIEYETLAPLLGWNLTGMSNQAQVFNWVGSQPNLLTIVQAALAACGVELPSG